MVTEAGHPQPPDLLWHLPCPLFHRGVSRICALSLHYIRNSSKVRHCLPHLEFDGGGGMETIFKEWIWKGDQEGK